MYILSCHIACFMEFHGVGGACVFIIGAEKFDLLSLKGTDFPLS